jgi:hypothetical protein
VYKQAKKFLISTALSAPAFQSYTVAEEDKPHAARRNLITRRRPEPFRLCQQETHRIGGYH